MITFTCPSCGHVEKVGGNGAPMEPPHPAVAPQTASAPSCPLHGPMTHKSGTNKSGTPYSGYFCGVRECETKPVWDPKR